MVMIILLLLSAGAHLVVPAPSTPASVRINLRYIIDEVHKCNRTFAKEFFVEDLKELVDAGCKEDFFCKVETILSNHKFGGTKKEENALLAQLKGYTKALNVDCGEVLKTVKTSNQTRPITVLLEDIVKCSRRRNFGSV